MKAGWGADEAAIVRATTPEAVASAAARMLEPGPSGASRVLVERPVGGPGLRLGAQHRCRGRDGSPARSAPAPGSNERAARRADLGRLLIDPALGLGLLTLAPRALALGLAGAEAAAFGRCLGALYEALLALDANPSRSTPC